MLDRWIATTEQYDYLARQRDENKFAQTQREARLRRKRHDIIKRGGNRQGPVRAIRWNGGVVEDVAGRRMRPAVALGSTVSFLSHHYTGSR